MLAFSILRCCLLLGDEASIQIWHEMTASGSLTFDFLHPLLKTIASGEI
jgi:hypothetical protein